MFQYQASINILILVIFGGMGSIWGVALGAVFVQVITSYMDNYQPWASRSTTCTCTSSSVDHHDDLPTSRSDALSSQKTRDQGLRGNRRRSPR